MLGVVLAGGEGRRMGFDKAGLMLGTEPLWSRQARVLRDAGAERVLVARRRGQAPVPHPGRCLDVFSGSGPMAGLHAALSTGARGWVAVLAVDMPGMDPRWFAWLRGFCGEGVGAAARHIGCIEPLAAIYPSESLGEVEMRLSRRDLSMQRLVAALAASGSMRIVPLAAASAGRAASLNAPQA
jgi:molybdopterin-guanine dinucleotide biosynthesis protein A